MNTGAENCLCPTAAIRRSYVEDPYFEYTIDEQLCIGCAKCVEGCNRFGNGSLFLQVRHDRCVNCNECAISKVCAGDAFRRVPARCSRTCSKPRATDMARSLPSADQHEGLRLDQALQGFRALRGWRIAVGCFMLALLLVPASNSFAQQRFPPPDFETGHKLPITTAPHARAISFEYLDVLVLAGCLITATWLIHRKRSRKGVVALSLFSLAYFGFWRKGCVCAIGSLQNVSLALGDSGYAIPIGVLAFFVLPIAVALFFGRSFCAGVCPHGVLQDLVLLKPLKVPEWLSRG